MAGKAHFKLFGRFNGATECTVTIDRNNNFIQVRPKRRRKVYEMRLEDVAEMIIWRMVKAEIIEKKKAKAAKRKGLLSARAA